MKTARYQELLREKFATPKPHNAEHALICETVRLRAVYGPNRALQLMKAAAGRVLGEVPQSRQREVDSQLADHIFSLGNGCDSLARTGVLGGPMPSDSQARLWDSLDPDR